MSSLLIFAQETQALDTATATASLVPIIIAGVIAIPFLIFWLISMIHAVKNDAVPNRVPWILAMLLVGTIVGPIYYFVVKRPFDKAKNMNGGMAGVPGQPIGMPNAPGVAHNSMPANPGMPQPPQAPSVPNMPQPPQTPNMPDMPNMPSMPQPPQAPSMPSMPSAPNPSIPPTPQSPIGGLPKPPTIPGDVKPPFPPGGIQ